MEFSEDDDRDKKFFFWGGDVYGVLCWNINSSALPYNAAGAT